MKKLLTSQLASLEGGNHVSCALGVLGGALSGGLLGAFSGGKVGALSGNPYGVAIGATIGSIIGVMGGVFTAAAEFC